ncbi:MAG TPA: prolipoprotein diacylglyceryl transferase [Bacteroidales bacterium]|jgi:prolipoprotein diacylglyceryl transferase|nr:prolipoprotein diacylglyceryl transferase [Bacteroidales bacterium]MDI9573592.1 prolipoprotein diacylglyceryl transferase [Bacteroidota bacterium]OQC61957.1 MAG: Prolipoprotein diacylglyceryl transferase [Bacteroidetes bacterium ADurb.Bin012]HNQ59003.1 prolipoprotein diacylglyceryl transferase [Bacteroidales bacterium]HNU20753.1 prolipoprotein diacylglyceryl transferase [Bacteroidales bacterium]
MYPKISDLINDIFGTHINLPIQSYGMMMAIAFVVGGLILNSELKRKEREGILKPHTKKIIEGLPATPIEIALSGFITFILGFKIIGIILDYNFFADHPQEFILSWKGSWLGGLLAGGFSAYYIWHSKEKKKLPKPKTKFVEIHPHQLTVNILFVAVVFGIIGAKLFDVMEHLDELVRDPLGTLFSFSGLTFYGGLILAAIAVVFYARKYGIAFEHIADATAPALILAYAVGRIGCQLSGDGCWGIPNTSPKPHWLSFLPNWLWAFNYPHNVINEGIPIPGCEGQHCFVLQQPVFPTPLYETIICTLFFLVLWGIRKKLRIPGLLFGIYLILNAFERFFIEEIRVNRNYHIIGPIELSQAQIIAIAIFITGVVFSIVFYRKYKHLQTQRI